MGNLYIAPHGRLVLRSVDWLAFLAAAPAENRTVSPHAEVVILPDDATAEQVLRAQSHAAAPPPLPPTT